MASFARGFDQLVGLGAEEIQFGILKRLRGTHSTLIEYKGPDASADTSNDLARPD